MFVTTSIFCGNGLQDIIDAGHLGTSIRKVSSFKAGVVGNTRQRSYSAGHILLRVVCPDARVVLNALIVFNQFGRDAIRKVRGHMIERTGS